MPEIINIWNFLKLKSEIPVVDVRSPSEFMQGHIPEAINIPLFDDVERSVVGTLYKNSGQKEAVLAGLDIAGKKMRSLAESGLEAAKAGKLLIHCWRGGMRSSSVAWLFNNCGIKCYILNGGYKSFRQLAHESFSLKFSLIVIGGLTGSGKTDLLKEFGKRSFQIINLEEIAHHKGSAFGSLGETLQNTNEQFENDLFTEILKLDRTQPVFIEDESLNIGRNIIPSAFYLSMSEGKLIIAEMETKNRIFRLIKDYGNYPKEELKECFLKLSKRLGSEKTNKAIEAIEIGNLEKAVDICLAYYDKYYNLSLSKKGMKDIIKIPLKTENAEENADCILKILRERKEL